MEPRTPVCVENEGLASFIFKKWQELKDAPKGISDNRNKALTEVFLRVCKSKTPIATMKDFFEIRGVGKCTLKLMQGYFRNVSSASETGEEWTTHGNNENKDKVTKRYIPQKNSAAYALLVTLHRGREKGCDFMRRQELIDAAEACGLSRVPIVKEKSGGRFGNSPKDWYTGWGCMKRLIEKGLVVKSSNPAKYMITEEGEEVARECLLRSCLVGSTRDEDAPAVSSVDVSDPRARNGSVFPTGETNRPTGYFCQETSPKSGDGGGSVDDNACGMEWRGGDGFGQPSMRPCSAAAAATARPPLKPGETFEKAYEVVLILDDREQFVSKGKEKGVGSELNIRIEARRLPVGDAIWVALRKETGEEYVLDFIVERKRVGDLRSSIRDGRYKDQKLRLVSCGLRKLIYVLEGDPNACDGSDGIKTACLTSEILEGFDVQRTASLSDTLRRYAHLTRAIAHYYTGLRDPGALVASPPLYEEFVRKCRSLDRMNVGDVFALQLMQVAHVTEDVALAVVRLHPTLSSLARAYAALDGVSVGVQAHEEMLVRCSHGAVPSIASRNIFRFLWAE